MAAFMAVPFHGHAGEANVTTGGQQEIGHGPKSPTDSNGGSSRMKTIIITLLILLSVISLTFIIERGLALRSVKVIPPSLRKAQQQLQDTDDMPTLKTYCEHYDSPYGRLLVYAINNRHLSRQENSESLQTRARHEISQLERGLVVLEITTGIAPLLGLVGTIFGLITLFKAMGVAGADQSQFADGISIALQATLLGLTIAIPSLTAWSLYSKRIETFAVELESHCDEFLRKFYGQKS
jgi:biopolymer transport protein ExbB